ncbi:MAG: HlyD family efflux transporter periplasmic adaptor subunit [Rhodobiaceae bacterium]|nr:HlyD family efflux transporter periplasmic adaptor subunit [Rhodobiaceae bacterium]
MAVSTAGKADVPPLTTGAIAAGDALWARFMTPGSSAEFLSSWFSLLSHEIAGLTGSVLLLERQDGGFARAASWAPDAAELAEADLEALETACRNAHDRRSVTVQIAGSGQTAVGYPVIVDGEPHALIGLLLDRGGDTLDAASRKLQWGCGWMHGIVHRRMSEQTAAAHGRATAALDALAAMEDAAGLEASLRAFANETLAILDADRVSVALLAGDRLKVRVLSQAADVERRSGEVRSLTQALEEARFQLDGVIYPPPPGEAAPIVAAHAAHSARAGAVSMISVPLIVRDTIVGMVGAERMTAEGRADVLFTRVDKDVLTHVAALCAPLIALKQREHRWISGRLRKGVGKTFSMLFGAGHAGIKLLAGAILLLIAVLSVLQTDLRVTAPANVRGELQQVAVAPFDGYIGESVKRAGDTVTAGEVMARLDDRDLELEALKLTSERNQLVQKQRQALAEGDRVVMATTAAQIARAEAELALTQAQLARVDIVAPLDGLIVDGDLSQRLGAPVKEGDVLFEVASGGDYTVVINVSEYDVRLVRPGATGTLALAGFSGRDMRFRVTRIASVNTAGGGRNAFRVEAELDDAPAVLRPGLEGVAKIDAGKARWIYALARPIVERMRIFLWTWLP